MTSYNLELMEKLNEEYKSKPLVKEPQNYEINERLKSGEKRLEKLNERISLTGLKVLEIGCGGGEISYLLASRYGCSVTGVDIYKNEQWQLFEQEKDLEFMVFNICEENPLLGRKYDLVVSFVAWEHIKNPFEALLQTKLLLKKGGKFYLYAWLYRSAMASHLYRHIYFPYPHLLFDDELVKSYALRLGVEQSWIDSFYDCNKLTYSEYKEYFSILGFHIVDEHLKFSDLDVDFYNRFYDKLSLYPLYDLTLDYFAVILENDTDKIDILPSGIGKITVSPNIENNTKNELLIQIQTVGKALEFSWDVFLNGKKIQFFKWGKCPLLKFECQNSGEYRFKCYVRRESCVKRVARWSDRVQIEI